MKKTAIVSSSILTAFLIFAAAAYAVTNDGTSTSRVQINNRINTSVNGPNTSVIQNNTHSKVTITCNGKTYTYESNGEDIDANPCEGSSVKINNNGSTSSGTPPNPTAIKEQIEEEKAEIERKIEEEKEKVKATITAIPKPTSTPRFSFDLGTWLRALILSFFN